VIGDGVRLRQSRRSPERGARGDWPQQLRRAGFPRFDGGASAGLPANLVDFCRAQAPPIAFTLGTGMRHGAEFFHAAVEACGMLGRRGILLTRHAQQLPTPLPRAVRHVAFAPLPGALALVRCRGAPWRDRHDGTGIGRRHAAAGVAFGVGPAGQRGARAPARRRQLARSTAPQRRAVGGSAGGAAETRGPGAMPCAGRALRRRRCIRASGGVVTRS